MKEKKGVIILFILFAFVPVMAFAEKIVLKSGQIIEGKLVEKTDQYIKIEFGGVVLTYFLDEIVRPGEDEKSGPASFDNNQNKQVAQTKESDVPAITLKEGPVGVQQINEAYYNLRSRGLQNFECELTGNFFDVVKGIIKSKYRANDPKSRVLDSLKLYLTFSRGVIAFQYTSTPTGDKKIDEVYEQHVSAIRNMLQAFFDDWGLFVIENPLLNLKKFTVSIEKLPNGYAISYDRPTRGYSSKILMDNNLRISNWKINYEDLTKEIKPHFVDSKQGLLMDSIDVDTSVSDIISSAIIRYQEVDGLQMLKQVIFNNISKKASSGQQKKIEINFSNYKIERIP